MSLLTDPEVLLIKVYNVARGTCRSVRAMNKTDVWKRERLKIMGRRKAGNGLTKPVFPALHL